MLDTAKQEYEALKQLCKKASQRRFPRTSTQVVPIISGIIYTVKMKITDTETHKRDDQWNVVVIGTLY